MVCEKCEEIGEKLTRDEKCIELGFVAAIQGRAATCQNCQTISELLQPVPERVVDLVTAIQEGAATYQNYQTISELLQERAFDLVTLSVYPDGTPSTLNLYSIDHPRSHFGDLSHTICELAIHNGSAQHGVSVDSAWIDISRIQQWLNFCDQTHGHECQRLHSQKQDSALKSLLLIDVEQGCLVQLPSTTRYFALSYVWGQLATETEARMDNIDILRRRGSITVTSLLVQLPATIRDALRLLQRLGERYLWVDRLCIVQDDEKNKLFHVLNMDTIFMNAYCTIVAADGTDADWGLPGVGSGSRPRHFLHRSLNFGHHSLQLLSDKKLKESHHATRGWTFQEMFLARRYIAFHGNTVFWQCQKSAWREDCPEKWESRESLARDRMTLHIQSWPNLSEWSTAVKEYNKRNLTFPEDMQKAFAGIEKSLEKSFPGGFLCGLPEFFFDLAMLWQPDSDSSSRRGAQYRTISDDAVPSWSWLGWTGEISDAITLRVSKYVDESRFQPLFKWYHVNTYTGSKRKIRNDHALRSIAFRHRFPKAAEIPPAPAQLYWPPYLQFRSHRAKFKIAAHDEHNRKDVIVVDAQGSKSGGLRVILSDPEATLIGQECELVAISRARRDIGYDFDLWSGFPRALVEDSKGGIPYDKLYEFYNVLWIKWEGEYAVREALGHIEKSAWERQDLEEIDVQLR